MHERTPVERAIVRDRWLVVGSLLLVAGACRAWIVPIAYHMYGARIWRCSSRYTLAQRAFTAADVLLRSSPA